MSKHLAWLVSMLKDDERLDELKKTNFSIYKGTKGSIKMNIIEFDGMNDVILVTENGLNKGKLGWNKTTEETTLRHPLVGTIIL